MTEEEAFESIKYFHFAYPSLKIASETRSYRIVVSLVDLIKVSRAVSADEGFAGLGVPAAHRCGDRVRHFKYLIAFSAF